MGSDIGDSREIKGLGVLLGKKGTFYFNAEK